MSKSGGLKNKKFEKFECKVAQIFELMDDQYNQFFELQAQLVHEIFRKDNLHYFILLLCYLRNHFFPFFHEKYKFYLCSLCKDCNRHTDGLLKEIIE